MAQIKSSEPDHCPTVRPDTAEALLDAAEDLFSRKGYAAVGVREIVEQAGVNLAAVKYHFGGKAGLYRQTIRRALTRSQAAAAWTQLEAKPSSQTDAVCMIARFIHAFLVRLLTHPDADRIGGLIVHEAAEPTDAMDFIVKDFATPNESMLVGVLAVLLPDASPRDLSLHAQTILGQVLHYRTYRPILERLEIGSLSDPENIRNIAAHITRVALLGLGSPVACERETIEIAIRNAGSDEGDWKAGEQP